MRTRTSALLPHVSVQYVVNNPSSAGLIDWPFVASYPEAINRHL